MVQYFEGLGVAMNNQQQAKNHQQNHMNQQIFAQVKAIFFDFFEQLVTDFCRRLEVEAGIQLSKTNKQEFAQVYTYLREQRTAIQNEYLAQVLLLLEQGCLGQENKVIVNLHKAKLAKAKSVEESYAINQIIRECNQKYFGEVARINPLLAKMYGLQSIKTQENPIAVEQLLNIFVNVIKNHDLEPDYRIALYKAFAVNVAQQMGFIYRELIKNVELDKATQQPVPYQVVNVEPEQATEVEFDLNDENQYSEDFFALQKKLDYLRARQTASAYACVPCFSEDLYKLTDLKRALVELRQRHATDLISTSIQKPLKWRLIDLLETSSEAQIQKGLARSHEDVLDFVSIAFNEISRDKKLSAAVKKVLMPLEPVFAELMLSDLSAINLTHPIMQLMNSLYEAVVFLNVQDHHDKTIFKKIEKSVSKIISHCRIDVCRQEAHELTEFVEKIKQRSNLVEQRTIQLAQNKEIMALAKDYVAQTIDNSVFGHNVPELVTDFLYNVWHDVLLVAHVKKAETKGLWEKAVKTMDRLVMSASLPANEENRSQVLAFLPKMMINLQAGLDIISYDKQEKDKFFKELSVFHTALMNKQAPTDTDVKVGPEKIRQQSMSSPVVDSMQEQDLPQGLELNNWLMFESETAVRWGKLSWKSSISDDYVFVAKSGAKLLEITLDELLKRLNSGVVTILEWDNRPFMEYVFGKVISHDGAL